MTATNFAEATLEIQNAAQDELTDCVTNQKVARSDSQESQQLNDTTVPEAFREILSGQALREWISPDDFHMSRMKCPQYWPDLFALVMTEEAAFRLIKDPKFQRTISDFVTKAHKFHGLDREIGFIIYSDDPPHHQKPNRPVAIFSRNIKGWRETQLVKVLLTVTGIEIAFDRFDGEVDISLPKEPVPAERLTFKAKVLDAAAVLGVFGWIGGIAAHLITQEAAQLLFAAISIFVVTGIIYYSKRFES